MKNYSRGNAWLSISSCAALVVAAVSTAAFVVAATANPFSPRWVKRTQNYLVSIAIYEQASAAWLHPEFESVLANEASVIKPALNEGFFERSVSTSAAKSVEGAKSKSLTAP